MKRKAQNAVEFVLVFPFLFVILFGIVEYAVYYRTANVVENIATEASVAASRQLVLNAMTCSNNNYTTCGAGTFNAAVSAATTVVKNRSGSLGYPSLTYRYQDLGATFGAEPYAVYQMYSQQSRQVGSVTKPLVILLVDYRNPISEGVKVQVIHQYRTILMGFSIPVFGAAPIVIIPRDVTMSSSRIVQYINY